MFSICAIRGPLVLFSVQVHSQRHTWKLRRVKGPATQLISESGSERALGFHSRTSSCWEWQLTAETTQQRTTASSHQLVCSPVIPVPRLKLFSSVVTTESPVLSPQRSHNKKTTGRAVTKVQLHSTCPAPPRLCEPRNSTHSTARRGR